MSKKFYLVVACSVLVLGFFCYPVEFEALDLPEGYWVGADDCLCDCIDLCECGASGFVHTKSFLGIKIPYHFSLCPKQPTFEQKQREEKKEETKRAQKIQELSHSCDNGWILVNDHCERCDSTETFKVPKSDCLKCNQYEELRVYESQSGECKPKE